MAIICRYYGHSLGHVSAGNGTIWLDEVSCRGTETDIATCSHKSWGSNDCDHSEDVSVRCTEPTITGIDLFIYLFIYLLIYLFIYLLTYLLIYLFIYLFIYDKGPESATDMPMRVNSELTHYKIRQISTENKRLKNRQTAKMV